MSRALFPAVVTAALLLAGCGGVDAPPSAAERSTPPAEPTASASPTRTTAPTTPTTTGSPRAQRDGKPGDKRGDQPGDKGTKMPPTMLPVARPDGSRTHLLAATALPGTWTTVSTRPETPRPVGACQQASLVDIGALHAVVRAYAGEDGSDLRARQVVARFADTKSAWRAHQVLRAWRDDCERWLDQPRSEVSPLEDVDTPTGTGHHYRATAGTKKDTDASGLGIVRKGRWLAIVAVSDVSAGWTKRAVRRIAATF